MNQRFRRCIWMACLLLTGAGAAVRGTGWEEFATPTAVTNVTIVRGDGSLVERGTILLADGRIVAAGREVDIPAHAERVDGTGLFAYPGFIDAHVHLGIAESVRTPEERARDEDVPTDPRERAQVATRDAARRGIRPHHRAWERYQPDPKQLERHRALGFTTAVIAPRDGILSGTSAVIHLGDAAVRRSVIAEDAAMHGSFATGEEGAYPRTLLGVFAQFRQTMHDARRHTRMQKYNERHPSKGRREPADPALAALQPLLARSQRLVFEAHTENEIHRALSLAQEFNLDIAISGAREAWKVTGLLKNRRVPLIVSIKFDEEPEYGRKKRGGSESMDEPPGEGDKGSAEQEKKKEGAREYEPLRLRQERRRLWEEQVANVARLHEAGIPFALRTRDFKEPKEFLRNLRWVLERGLPPEAAVQALTTHAAEVYGLADQLGDIRPGRVADLTLLTAPLQDKKAKVALLFIDGKRMEIDEESLRRGDRERDENSPADSSRTSESSKSSDRSARESEEMRLTLPEPDWPVELKVDRVPRTVTSGNVLLRDATILPVTSPTLTNASLLIRDGKIAAMGTNLVIPEGTTVIDAAGLFVLPGFVDAHSHLGLDSVNESPDAVSAEVRIADVLNPHHVGLYRALAGGTTTHHVMHGSANPIGGQNAICKLRYGRTAEEMIIADAPAVIKFALGENVVQANFPANWGKRYPNTRMGVEATLRSAFEAAKAYRRTWSEYEEESRSGADVPIPRTDLRLEALARVLAGEMTVHAHCYRSDEILRLFAVAEEYGIRIGTLHHVLEGYRVAPEIARHGSGASTFSNDWAYKVEAFEAIPHNAAMMTVQRINVSINSDSPLAIRYLGQEACKSVRWGGLDENQVLRLVTMNAALQLQIERRVGSLEVGKDGDLAVFNGHPLNTFSKCVMTVLDGEVVFEDARPAPTEPAGRFAPRTRVDRTIPETPHRAYAIVGATVHPIAGPTIENGTVVVLEERIHAVGPSAGVVVPPGAGVIDGAGLHVYPGLIDAGSMLGLREVDSLRATRDHEEIGAFNPHVRAASAVHPHSAHVRVARTAGITTAMAKPTGGRIAGQSAIIRLDGWTAPDMLRADTFALHLTVPSLPVHLPEDKDARKRLLEEHRKAVRELEDFMRQARHYAAVRALPESDESLAPDVHLALEAMIPYLRGQHPIAFTANTYKQIVDALEFAEKHQLKPMLTGAQESWKLATILAERDIPVILGTPFNYPAGEFEPWDSVYRCAAELDRAGVRYCFGSENAAESFNLGIQVGMAVAHGLARQRAEYALTLGAARMLGIDDQVGSLEVGKRADLMVVTDSPLQTSSIVTHLFIDGRPIELSSVQTENYEKFLRRPAPKLAPAVDLRGPASLTGR